VDSVPVRLDQSRVKHIAWFAVVLAVYDAIFAFGWPVTNQWAQRFIGWPLDPVIGYRSGVFNDSFGLGDLLVYTKFVISVRKAYGMLRPGSRCLWW
jgi:hypothetical protein